MEGNVNGMAPDQLLVKLSTLCRMKGNKRTAPNRKNKQDEAVQSDELCLWELRVTVSASSVNVGYTGLSWARGAAGCSTGTRCGTVYGGRSLLPAVTGEANGGGRRRKEESHLINFKR